MNQTEPWLYATATVERTHNTYDFIRLAFNAHTCFQFEWQLDWHQNEISYKNHLFFLQPCAQIVHEYQIAFAMNFFLMFRSFSVIFFPF